MVRSLRPLVAVAGGGLVGSVVRWSLVEAVGSDAADQTTFVINVVGSLLLGALLGQRERMAPERLLALGTGFAGGLTTFSGYAVAVATRLDDGHVLAAATNGVGTPVATLIAAGVGFRAARVATVAGSARRARRRGGRPGGSRGRGGAR